MFKKIFKKNINTRVLPRIKLENLIKYRIDSGAPGNVAIANVKDIGGSGILFLSKAELSRENMLSISINFPGLDPIETKAQVVRVRRTKAGEYEIGAHFISIDEQKRRDLSRRIEFILKKIADRKSLLGGLKRVFRI